MHSPQSESRKFNMTFNRALSILLAILVTSTAQANERLLYQLPRIPQQVEGAFSYIQAADSGQRAFDNFRMLGGGTVNNVRWQGFLTDGTNAPSPTAGNWQQF